MLYVGVLSGTSLDGVTAALCEIEGRPPDLRARVLSFRTEPYPPERRERIRGVAEGGTTGEVARLSFAIGEWFAEVVARLLAEASVRPGAIRAVGSHGQTVWHEPPDATRPAPEGVPARGATLQIGEPAVLAERLGVDVVSDFRARDVAAGGHGAPLVPFLDRALFADAVEWRALQNLGGIGNVTLVPPRSRPAEPLLAFDTGPGVAVLDAVVEIATEGRERFDRDGRLGARGHPDAALVRSLLEEDAYFAKAPPKSTGRERYGRAFARRLVDRANESARVAGRADPAAADLVATAAALTAATIADAYRRFVSPRAPGLGACFLSGGGARNPSLVAAIAGALETIPVRDLADLGVDPEAKEALLFAVLAHCFLERIPAGCPEVTGAAGARVLGRWTPC